MTKERLRLFSYEDLCKIAERGNIPALGQQDKERLIDTIIQNCEEDKEERQGLLNLAQQIEARKYSVSIDEEIDIFFDEYHEFPDRYNETILVFMLRDPSWGFVFWDIENSKLAEIRSRTDFKGFFLRVIELSTPIMDSENILEFYDIPVRFEDLDQYINIPESNSYYVIEMKARFDSEELFISRSNILETTRKYMAPVLEPLDDSSEMLNRLSGFVGGLREFPENLDLENIPQRISPLNAQDEGSE